jgi:hypothetical protein
MSVGKPIRRLARKAAANLRHHAVNPLLARGRRKVFIIGRNKTGTTSIKHALHELGLVVAHQPAAERLLPAYEARDWERIVRYCRHGQAFQDFPFSYPETFKHIDAAFPGSLFVLSVRDSAEQWYESVTRFHAKRFGYGRIPTAEQLKRVTYRGIGGYLWRANRALYRSPENDPYHKPSLIRSYEEHNRSVREHFADRGDLLVVNVAEPGAYIRFCEFLGERPVRETFLWRNRTADLPHQLAAPFS